MAHALRYRGASEVAKAGGGDERCPEAQTEDVMDKGDSEAWPGWKEEREGTLSVGIFKFASLYN